MLVAILKFKQNYQFGNRKLGWTNAKWANGNFERKFPAPKKGPEKIPFGVGGKLFFKVEFSNNKVKQ